MPALTRTEAEARARLLDVLSYSIDLDLTRGDVVFGCTTSVRFSCTEPGADTFVEIKPHTLHRAVLNGRELAPSALRDNRLVLEGLAAENELVVEADMEYSRTGEGMHRFTDPIDGEAYLYSQGALDDAQRVFPAFDQPDLKATFEIAVTAPRHWTVLSNSTGERTEPGRWRFPPTPRISTYLAVVVAGPYHSISAEHDGIPLGLHCRRSLARYLEDDAEELLDITRRCLDHYHRIFDERYPFDSYDQAFVPELNFGAMENPGCVTFRDDFVFRSAVTDAQREERAIVVAHEMAHMWFGDLVTMRWWDDLWLNESFAEYMGHQVTAEVTRYTDTWAGFGARRKAWGYDSDQRASTHPVAPERVEDTAEATQNVDGISYAKGASAVRQLVAWVGEEAFLAGLNEYFARHRYANATLADFLDAINVASGRDVHDWARRWLRTTGVDTLHAEPEGQELARPHRIAVGLYDRPEPGAALVPRERLLLDVPPGPQGPLALPTPRPDLVLLNDGDLTYAKVRLSPSSWRTATECLGSVPDPVSRAVLWNTARDLVRDGELPAGAFIDLVAGQLPDEPVVAITEAVLEFARQQVADRYLPGEERAGALTVLSEVCRRILRRTEDGSDPGLRLTAVRGLISCAQGPRACAEVADWLDADEVPGGPGLDPALRWQATLRLCVLGEAGEKEIIAELGRDPSATGREGAARCRAALPAADAKAAAWEALFHDDTQSNYLMTALAQGFWQPEQGELLAPWVPRYFPEAVAATRRRGGAIGRILSRYAFPEHAVDPGVLRTGEECLAAEDLPPSLRRGLADQLDDLRRALRARRSAEG
ncbi:aminopeptidase [Wenjunlia vitaminophila]|uniref:Aminopeptidase N n=1 Tax=Wenjunlia vitaminophila TaxID=76728 RepID=A0A0T6LT71_WENVI|nr:aminopeptidase N [Wenjunlia vitaminophila]KRV49208.1 aminopeptidase [Wenjunlia vitaminophila]